MNDEMVSEFKYQGYLEPLNDAVMAKELLSKYSEGSGDSRLVLAIH